MAVPSLLEDREKRAVLAVPLCVAEERVEHTDREQVQGVILPGPQRLVDLC